MADDTSQFDSQFQGDVKGVSIGTGNVIYNYFYSYQSQATTEEVAETDNLPCPYRGLFHFGPNDVEFFFGREDFIKELYQATKTERLIPVLGASGSGKSSVVLAGLVPKLVQEGHWQFTHCRPGSEPFHSLALSLVPLYAPGLNKTEQMAQARQLAGYLQKGELPLGDVFAQIRQNYPTDQILLIIDQFEELYTLCGEVEIRHRFLDALIADLPGTVVMTMRADFLGNALSYRPFADVLNDQDYLLGPMNREELTEVIVKPAEAQGVGFEAGLVERILDDVDHQPGNLPLLEFALTQLWHQRRGKTLTHEVYAAIGEVEGALARHADETYGTLTEGEKERVHQIFIQLVRPGEGAEDTRRVAVKGELGEQSWSLVKQLADARLVVTSRDGQKQETVEVVHEALIRNWGELRGWMETDRTFRAWQERLRGAKRQWEVTGKDAGSLLRGAFLAEAQERLEERPQDLGAEAEFIRLSVAEKEKVKRRATMTVSGIVIGSLTAVVISTSLFFTARHQQKQAELSEADSLARYSLALSNEGTKDLEAAIEVIKAGKILQKHQSSDLEVMSALMTQVYQSRERQSFYSNQGSVYSVSYSPDGQTLASGGNDGTIKVWNLETQAEVATLTGHQEWVYSVSYSPDGKTLASGGADGTIKLWNLETQAEVATLTGHPGGVSSVSYSPDGQTLASGGNDGTIKVWNLETQAEVATLPGHPGGVSSVSYSPDGQTLASGGGDATIKVWNLETQEEVATLTGHQYWVNSVSYSPDGKTLASGGRDATIKVWNLETQAEVATLTGHPGGVTSVSYSPDGKTLASGSGDGTIKVWNLETQEEVATLPGHLGGVNSVSYSPDGKTLASGGRDATIKVWNLETEEEVATLPGHLGGVYSVSYSPDGKTLASGGDDGTIKVWNLETQEEVATLPGHLGGVYSVSYSPDGKTLASGGGGRDGTIKVWNLEAQEEVATLTGHQWGVTSVSYSPDGKTLASGSGDGTIKVWNLETQEEVATLPGHPGWVSSVSYSPDGKTLASSWSGDGTIKVWDVDFDSLMQRTCQRIRPYLDNPNAPLTKEERRLCDGIGEE
ncbi:WD40 repeat domain-containing protein [Roseofilum sp. BLCC_M154]|uniref:WD40 repeat domain-containing protein n=1 Tax=Roseofilum acuticapitatum BLCC-M154 TaxID=3022444 RepID=A0ABT7AY97_9CYAN|nr:WD40 repeat domain-containing protein [Roseofilum acuticapitatum]MDJ1171879.1 WD40 repeat domain-containing protein [Roseofilum acuticapitatum BLCC-M154]